MELIGDSEATFRRKSVLAIEDNFDYANVLRVVLARNGAFRLEAAGSLHEGLDAIASRHPDVILVDLDLPDSSGYGTFLEVRRVVRHGCMLVLTASDDDALAVRAIEDGAQDYLVKEFTDLRALPRRIQLAFERQKLQGSRGLDTPRIAEPPAPAALQEPTGPPNRIETVLYHLRPMCRPRSRE